MSVKTLKLKSQQDRRLRAGHLWVFSNEVDTRSTPLTQFSSGDLAWVENHQGKVLGTALVSPDSLICARLISRKPMDELSKSLLKKRIKYAVASRHQWFSEPCYRMVYGDSDGLPGLIVDRFYDYLVMQINSAAMEAHKALVVDALIAAVQPKGILIKNDGKMRELEGLEEYNETVLEAPPQWLPLIENGVKFEAPVYEGQKTGWFYDHRPNRMRLQQLCKGKRVLDVFSYIGGWGVQAAAAGAESVTCLDASAFALDGVMRNAKLNGVSNMQTLQGDAFSTLKNLVDEKHKYDVVIMDPPAFIAKRKDVKAGEQAYHRANQLAMRLLDKEGLLFSASCSMHLREDRLIDVIRSTGRQLDRQVQLLEFGGQGADHPIHPSIPETRYIKSILCRVTPTQF